MKKRGFDTQEIVEKLHEKGIEVKPQTLTKYLTEARRLKESRKDKRQDTPPRRSIAAKATAIAECAGRNEDTTTSLRPDIPLDEL